ncbi:hypothetical protein AVEN_218672-1 [Araneus ventricosus]|uniref:Uncharacterized protein n=1 Tax=Araneus ventricosus TaxID=182803 RepID=A0A4Y2B651_ARAVE|nr:hypothetical protein AVEN_218672-1 [Araneus ventricosus]
MTLDLGDKMKVPENTEVIPLSSLGTKSCILLVYSCDVTLCRKRVWRCPKGGQNHFGAGELSVIESAVTVITSDMLSVCVSKLYKCCFHCYPCFNFP